jgi:hypothetical protein
MAWRRKRDLRPFQGSGRRNPAFARRFAGEFRYELKDLKLLGKSGDDFAV